MRTILFLAALSCALLAGKHMKIIHVKLLCHNCPAADLALDACTLTEALGRVSAGAQDPASNVTSPASLDLQTSVRQLLSAWNTSLLTGKPASVADMCKLRAQFTGFLGGTLCCIIKLHLLN